MTLQAKKKQQDVGTHDLGLVGGNGRSLQIVGEQWNLWQIGEIWAHMPCNVKVGKPGASEILEKVFQAKRGALGMWLRTCGREWQVSVNLPNLPEESLLRSPRMKKEKLRKFAFNPKSAPEGEKFPVIALDYQHRRSASALFVRLYCKC